MLEAIAAIKKAKNILIVTHTDPDGDAVGSMLSMYLALKSSGKKVSMYSRDQVPEIYRFLPQSDKVKHSLGKVKYDIVIAVDCGGENRVGKGIKLKTLANKVVNIDHHPDNTNFGDINVIENLSSVSEILFRLFGRMDIYITKDIAACLYAGIMTDTGNFRYDYTTAQTLDTAAFLARAGADISGIAMAVYESKTQSAVKVLGAAMYRLETSKTGKVAWTVLPQKLMDSIGAKSEDLTGIVDQIRSIKGVEVAVLFREEDDGIKVNFRSKFKVNVSDIAKKLGGGGHIRASGAILNCGLDEAKDRVLAEVFKVIK